MRKEFSSWCETTFASNEQHIFLTGDLGFQAFETVSAAMKERFINAGVAEQNMVSVAAALASQGLVPLCYSIAPFTVFRPHEQIRLDVCLHERNVKIVGNGGGYGYGIMGASHHALEDLAVLSSLQAMKCFVPAFNEDVVATCDAMMAYEGPSYLRLGFAVKPAGLQMPPFAPIRKLADGGQVTVIAIGPVIKNVFDAMAKSGIECDVFCVSQLPLTSLTEELSNSVRRTGRVLVVEEHVVRGGLGEHLALHFLGSGLAPQMAHAAARGYPSKRYGSQAFHQNESGLDADSLASLLRNFQQ